jgi:hypothetical protein
VAVRDKTQNLRRLEAQRNELNHKGASVPPSTQIRSDLAHRNRARRARSRVRSGDARPFNASVNHTRRMRAPSTDPRRHPSPRDPPRVGPFQLFPIITTYAPSSFRLAVRMLREEIQLLQEPGSYVGEVVKVMGKTKVLVKVRIDPSHRAHPCTRPPRRRVASADPFFIPRPNVRPRRCALTLFSPHSASQHSSGASRGQVRRGRGEGHRDREAQDR